MKPLQNFDETKQNARYSASEKLPVGGYVARVLQVEYKEGQNGNSDMIILAFDITEGEFTGFFKKQYEANTQTDKKWKGRVTIYVPKDDGTEKDEWTKNSFARWINAFEDSNDGFRWDWDEKKLKDKSVGLVFGETGNVIEGKEVVYTECRFPASTINIREGKFKTPMLKQRNGYGKGKGNASDSTNFLSVGNVGDEEIPFLN